MRAWMKRHKILTGVGALLLVPVTLGGLNYSGMCIPEGRWLSDEEKIDIVIKKIIAAKQVYLMYGVAGSKDYEMIPYASVEEFKKENPNCCEVKFAYKPQDVQLIHHLLGKVSFWIPVVRSKTQYEYDGKVYEYDNNISTINGFGLPYIPMSNCGVPFRK